MAMCSILLLPSRVISYIYKDQQKEGEIGYKIIDDNDRVIKGHSTPCHYFGFTVNAGWKGIDFSMMFSGVAGISQYLNSSWYTNVLKNGTVINKKFLDAVDELTEKNNLHPGPDFYSYFLKHPELIGSDGVHPNGSTGGGQAMHHLWAEALAPLYAESNIENEEQDSTFSNTKDVATVMPSLFVDGNNIRITGIDSDMTVDIISTAGTLEEQHQLPNSRPFEFTSKVTPGIHIIVVKWNGGMVSYKVTL